MMKHLLFTVLFIPFSIQAEQWQSGTKQVQLIELYTSEGCHSCPPADRWLSTFTDNPKLFTDVLPIAFHVDYWNYLGWVDPFASAAYSQRQRNYVASGHVSQAYTPEFIVNNEEWYSWFHGNREPPEADAVAGVLTATLSEDNMLSVNFSEDQDAILNIAYLGMGLTSDIKAGENRNKQLHHDFVALSFLELAGNQNWTTTLADIPQMGQERTALAIWVSDRHSKEILQATGGYLKNENENENENESLN